MAKIERICSIEGCGKAYYAKGWCREHYQRFCRHGDPVGGRTFEGEPITFLEGPVFSFEGDECLIWPYDKSRRGYGRVKRNGKASAVHRIVCEREHGPPPTSEHQAAHSCGKGHEGCCNRKHLAWKTPKENQADRLNHGTHNRGERNGWAKLAEGQVREILSMTGISNTDIARKFDVTPTTVGRIKKGRGWAHVK